VFAIDGTPVLALVAGDRRCDPAALPAALNLSGQAGRCDADMVRAATGFAIGGVAPVGHLTPLPTAGLFGSGHDRFMRAGVAAEGSATHLGC
jgi:prolyl-tRNA editing enzyme YbaK/EbsC (Cys-tRNA(Pro) deacylase)